MVGFVDVIASGDPPFVPVPVYEDGWWSLSDCRTFLARYSSHEFCTFVVSVLMHIVPRHPSAPGAAFQILFLTNLKGSKRLQWIFCHTAASERIANDRHSFHLKKKRPGFHPYQFRERIVYSSLFQDLHFSNQAKTNPHPR